MKTHYNYVAYFPRTNRIKIGMTGNPDKRVTFYRQEVGHHGIGHVAFVRGDAQEKLVTTLVEQTMRDRLRGLAIKGHFEWFIGDVEDFRAAIAMTAELQKEVHSQLYEESAHA